jgi:hypothetical protein
MARSYFCDHCKHAMAKGGRVTLNIAVSEPHEAPFPLKRTLHFVLRELDGRDC